MAFRGQKSKFCLAALALGLVMAPIALPQTASAGFLDRLFGDVRRAVEGPSRSEPSSSPSFNPFAGFNPPANDELRADNVPSGPSRAFCVRTCDGHFFPVQASAGTSAAESCRSFCPASETKIFGGGNIDTAVAPDGRRYADLPNAFVYRKAIVKGCTCNGKDSFGLARLDAATDPTLRPGDIVASKNGLMAYNGSSNSAASFTPIESYSRISKATRDKLSETKISPQTMGAASDITNAIPVTDNPRDPRRGKVQLAR